MMLKASKIDTNSAPPPSDDPYAALRQLSDQSSFSKLAPPSSMNFMNTSPKPLYNTSIYPTTTNSNINNELSSRVSESSDGSSWQGINK